MAALPPPRRNPAEEGHPAVNDVFLVYVPGTGLAVALVLSAIGRWRDRRRAKAIVDRLLSLETDKAETGFALHAIRFRLRAIEAHLGYQAEPVTLDEANYRWRQ